MPVERETMDVKMQRRLQEDALGKDIGWDESTTTAYVSGYETDPKAFLIVCDARDVLGEGFGEYNKEEL